MFALLITDSSGDTHIHPISGENGGSYTLGRSEECDIALPSEVHISRIHCILTVCENRVFLKDNHSSNGIYIGSHRVTEEYMITEREYLLGNCSMVLIHTHAPSSHQASPDMARTDEPVPSPLNHTAENTSPESPPPPQPESASPQPQETTLPPIPEIPPPTPAVARSLRSYKAEPRKLRGIRKAPAKPATAVRRKSLCTQVKAAARPAKKLHTPTPHEGPRVQHAPGVPGNTFGLPVDFLLQFRLLNTTEHLPEGTPLRFGITAETDCYLHLLHYDCEGTPTLLVPGIAGDDNRIFQGTEMQFPRPYNNEYELIVEPPLGQDTIIALACTENVPFSKVWQKEGQQSNTPMEAIKQAIEDCSSRHTRWSASMLYLHTGK